MKESVDDLKESSPEHATAIIKRVPPRLSRRFFFGALAAGAMTGGGLLGWTLGVEPHWLVVSRRNLHIPNLPPHWHGKRLLHISDWHVGCVSLPYLQGAMRRVNELQPDLLVVTGDFVDHSNGVGQALASVLKVIETPSMGALACLGNHDYGHGWSEIEVADRVAASVESHGIQVLRNERVELDGLHVFGIDDFWSPRFGPVELLQSATHDQAALCLCHNPDVCDVSIWDSFRGVILSGHTHGGQCKPPFLPPPLLPVVNKRYTSGLFDLGPGRQLFISRGIGHTMRVRFNCPPEIACLTLLPASVDGPA